MGMEHASVRSYGAQPRRRLRAVAAAVLVTSGLSMAAAPAWAVTGWHTTTTPNPGVNFTYQMRDLGGVVAFSSTNVWAVGSYSIKGVGAAPLLVHWTGKAWTRVKPPTPHGGSGNLRFISARGPADIWAIGNQNSGGANIYLLHSDGHVWHAVPTAAVPATFSAWSIAADTPTSVWLGGYNNLTGGPQAMHWDGKHWTSSTAPLPAGAQGGQLSGIYVIPGTHRPLGVGYSFNGSTFSPYAVVWSGGAWHRMAMPATRGAELRAVVVLSATSAWAVGTRYPTTSTFQTFTQHWNGKTWTTIASPNRSAVSNTLLGISAFSATNVWAVGYSTGCARTCYRSLAEHFNGKSWSISKTPNPSLGNQTFDAFWDAAVVPGTNQVWAVGTRGPARPANNAEFTFAARAN